LKLGKSKRRKPKVARIGEVGGMFRIVFKKTEPYEAHCPACGKVFIVKRDMKEPRLKMQCPKCTRRFEITFKRPI